jgi:membrane protein DedA with SNARE-associated domain
MSKGGLSKGLGIGHNMPWSLPLTGHWLGLVVIFTATALEFLGLPAPGGPLPVFMAASSASNKEILLLTLVAAVGSALGDAPWYFLGRIGGGRVLLAYCKFTLGSRSCVANTERLFNRYGIVTLTFSKFFPGVRLFAPPFAGSARYPFRSFFYLDLLGGFLWAGSLVLFGKLLGPQIPWAFTPRWVWAITIVPVVIFILARLAKRMIHGPAEEAFQLPLKSEPEHAMTSDAET